VGLAGANCGDHRRLKPYAWSCRAVKGALLNAKFLRNCTYGCNSFGKRYENLRLLDGVSELG
jgi:hypothetical protein